MKLSFVGEGKRDRVMMPNLTANLLGRSVEPCNRGKSWRWPRAGKWRRKLLLAVRSAIDDGACGLVAARDGDKDPSRVRKELKKARDYVRSKSGFPVAIGCPNPHAEAWLLDDQEAVRTSLGLAPGDVIPPVSNQAKQHLNELMRRSPEYEKKEDCYKFLAVIASEVSIDRCSKAQETGLKAFREDVRAAFLHLVQS